MSVFLNIIFKTLSQNIVKCRWYENSTLLSELVDILPDVAVCNASKSIKSLHDHSLSLIVNKTDKYARSMCKNSLTLIIDHVLYNHIQWFNNSKLVQYNISHQPKWQIDSDSLFYYLLK